MPLYAKPAQVPETGRAPIQIQTRDIVAETDLYCMTLAIYFEGGSTFEPEIGQRHIARVITERAKADRSYWGGKTICGVVFYKRQGRLPVFLRLPADRPPHAKEKRALARIGSGRSRRARGPQ